jgi:two-component system, chemotaxis family, protein-glutamate methylesterase/glutaminase
VKRVLIVDDSPLMRRLLSDIFATAGDFDVQTATTGLEVIEKLHHFQPDVITLDIHMPGMDGLACLDRIMIERPTPVVMVSSFTAEGAEETLKAMALGAIDFIPKPRGAVSIEIEAIAENLITKVRTASNVRMSRTTRLAERVRLQAERFRQPAARPKAPVSNVVLKLPPASGTAEGLVLIGTSTGGPTALDALLGPIPASFPWPLVIAQHMPASFTGALARRLDQCCQLTVIEVSKPQILLPGHAYIGRGDADVVVSRRKGALVAMAAPLDPTSHWHPGVDRLVRSAMSQLGPERLVGVLMTGMGNDGAASMTELAKAGGHVIAESEETAVVWGMPGALVAAGGADYVLPVHDIAAKLVSLVSA